MRLFVHSVAILVAAAIGSPAIAINVGQIDTFSISNEGWFTGGGQFAPIALPVATTGGPNGAGDAYLEIESLGGSGPGSRLVGNNAGQWIGNYIAAGVTSIEMDLRNLGNTDLNIRLLFEDPAGAAPLNVATTSDHFLPAGGGWTHVRFSVAPADLIAIQGNVTAALTGTTFFRLFHNPVAAFPGPLLGGPPAIVASLGVDNIAAVPEPSVVVTMLFGLGVLGLASRVRGRRARRMQL